MGRIGHPEDVAGAILYLAGNGFVTGTVLDVSGGLTLARGLTRPRTSPGGRRVTAWQIRQATGRPRVPSPNHLGCTGSATGVAG